MSEDELAKEEVAARDLRVARKSELDALGGWNDRLTDDPIVGPAMGRYSATLSLIDAVNNAKRRLENLAKPKAA
jgi:hypothetical protein